jgi:hypothetical protein
LQRLFAGVLGVGLADTGRGETSEREQRARVEGGVGSALSSGSIRYGAVSRYRFSSGGPQFSEGMEQNLGRGSQFAPDSGTCCYAARPTVSAAVRAAKAATGGGIGKVKYYHLLSRSKTKRF